MYGQGAPAANPLRGKSPPIHPAEPQTGLGPLATARSQLGPYSTSVHTVAGPKTTPTTKTDRFGSTLWTVAMLIMLIVGCFGLLYFTKPVYYELYAIANPMHDKPAAAAAAAAAAESDGAQPLPDPAASDLADSDRPQKLDQEAAATSFAPAPLVVTPNLEPAVEGEPQAEAEATLLPTTAEGRVGADAGVAGDVHPAGSCAAKKATMIALTEKVQRELYAVNHPASCKTAPLLECDSSKGMDQGTGSRLFFLTRCLAKCLESGRACVLNPNMKGTAEMLSPFLPWGNCTMKDVKDRKKQKGSGNVVVYEPKSLPDIAIVDGVKGPLTPKQYAHMGYFWWKAQEIHYALRPTPETEAALAKHKADIGWPADGTPVHGMQVRRTDKVEGKLKEAEKVPLAVYAEYLAEMAAQSSARRGGSSGSPMTVLLATDDATIQREAVPVEKQFGLRFLRNPPAPARTIGVFKGRVLKDALDILALRDTDVLVFTYSSGFGALAYLSKLAKEGFCVNWISVDQGKREWPKYALIGNGGMNGVSTNSKLASRLCPTEVSGAPADLSVEFHLDCTMKITNINVGSKQQRALFSSCNC